MSRALIFKGMSALIMGLTVCLIGISCHKIDSPAEPGQMLMSLSCEMLEMESGETRSVDVNVSGDGAKGVNLTFDAPQGWVVSSEEISSSKDGAYRFSVKVTSPYYTSKGEIVFEASNFSGEIVSAVVSLSNKGVDITDDPYSTPASVKSVQVEQFRGSQIAFNLRLLMGADVEKFYYGVMTRKEAEKYTVFLGDDWMKSFRDSLIDSVNSMSFDHWFYSDHVVRYGTVDEPLEPGSEYYVYLVAKLKNGEYSNLEMTRVFTLPKFERNPQISPAKEVKVSDIDKSFDCLAARLTPSSSVQSFVYTMVDESAIAQYKDLFGNKWDEGFLDMRAYKYTYELPQKRVQGSHLYQWPNLKSASKYYLLVVWFDLNDEPHLEMTSFFTDTRPEVAGAPSVSFTRVDFTSTTATYKFVPNSDCGAYTVDVWSEGDIALFSTQYADQWPQKLIEYASRYGGVLQGEQTVSLDINKFYPMADEQIRKWTDDTYMLVVMPFDKNGVYDDTAITYTHIK